MFHSQDGLFFERQDGGDVRVIKTADGNFPKGDNITFETILSAASWCNVVSTMSAAGETYETWNQAMRFHQENK